jgi:hypothetical protein
MPRLSPDKWSSCYPHRAGELHVEPIEPGDVTRLALDLGRMVSHSRRRWLSFQSLHWHLTIGLWVAVAYLLLLYVAYRWGGHGGASHPGSD